MPCPYVVRGSEGMMRCRNACSTSIRLTRKIRQAGQLSFGLPRQTPCGRGPRSPSRCGRRSGPAYWDRRTGYVCPTGHGRGCAAPVFVKHRVYEDCCGALIDDFYRNKLANLFSRGGGSCRAERGTTGNQGALPRLSQKRGPCRLGAGMGEGKPGRHARPGGTLTYRRRVPVPAAGCRAGGPWRRRRIRRSAPPSAHHRWWRRSGRRRRPRAWSPCRSDRPRRPR